MGKYACCMWETIGLTPVASLCLLFLFFSCIVIFNLNLYILYKKSTLPLLFKCSLMSHKEALLFAYFLVARFSA